MQFGIKAANYPLTEEDMLDLQLPKKLSVHRKKLFGLTIDPERLSAIRTERKANSRYASLNQCYREVDEVEMLYERENIPYINATNRSIEEISTRILETTGLKRSLSFCAGRLWLGRRGRPFRGPDTGHAAGRRRRDRLPGRERP